MHLSRQRAVPRLARRRATPVSVLASNLSTLLGPPAQPPRDRPSGLRLATRQDVRVGINFNQVPQPKQKNGPAPAGRSAALRHQLLDAAMQAHAAGRPAGRSAALRHQLLGLPAKALPHPHSAGLARPATLRLALRKPVPKPIPPTSSATLRIAVGRDDSAQKQQSCDSLVHPQHLTIVPCLVRVQLENQTPVGAPRCAKNSCATYQVHEVRAMFGFLGVGIRPVPCAGR